VISPAVTAAGGVGSPGKDAALTIAPAARPDRPSCGLARGKRFERCGRRGGPAVALAASRSRLGVAAATAAVDDPDASSFRVFDL
jgi:hypothetical protein